jgi:hypothetical protein
MLLNNVDIETPDLWKTIVITLFVLSMINERITNFIKLNIESVLPKLPGPIGGLFGGRTNFKYVENDPVREKKRERGIINFAVLCGFIVAAACGADLLYMLGHEGDLIDEPLTDLLAKRQFLKWVQTVFDHLPGYLLTGFFISLGSKFWHDLLDQLLYSSNLKRKLTNEPELFRSQSGGAMREFVELTKPQLAQLAQAQLGERFRSQPNVTDVVVGQARVDGLVREAVIVYLRDDDTTKLPTSEATVRLVSGRPLPLPVVYVKNYGNRPKSQFRVGDPIRSTGSQFGGRLCCLLNGIDGQDQQPSTYALTCSHVLANDSPENMFGFLDVPNTVEVDIDGTTSGLWRYGFHSESLDIGMVRLNAGLLPQFSATLNLQKATRALTDADVGSLTVKIWTQMGAQTATMTRLLQTELSIEYGNGETKGMVGLMELSQMRRGLATAPTQGGDSGAPVFDEKNRLIGMIVAGNNSHSYAIPMPAILDDLALSFQSLTLQL